MLTVKVGNTIVGVHESLGHSAAAADMRTRESRIPAHVGDERNTVVFDVAQDGDRIAFVNGARRAY